MKYISHLIFCCFLFSTQVYAQFEFKGKINSNFQGTKVYLLNVEDYSKSDLVLASNIIQEIKVDSIGEFNFSGNFLSEKNKFYKIHLDQCNNDITDYKHLLNECSTSQSVVFIANNKDSIYFPLNSLGQMFCSITHVKEHTAAVQKIDSIQDYLLMDLHDTKSDTQRNIIFENYLVNIQNFSKSLNEPLAELYAYKLYASRNSFGRDYYLKNIKKSDYYNSLLSRLEEKYPNSDYLKQYKSDLKNDLPLKKSVNYTLVLLCLLLASIGLNVFLFRKNKKKKSKLNYKKVLSTQEQKVFELMQKGLQNKNIASELFISISTVKTHINNIYSKLNINSRKEVDQFF
ncbi:regulatory protein, luxR family [Lutibacter oricola]|uniref:Regulatory protein, luxR family n=1 Tax=Lutibacter oricola TaxID=762486 RepID=A0A1H3AML5_9FLAO|nr:LuxR C-terminal-related transcriptional regulator [Lutibacter oricola]SDX30079.1 regulatory protein, luxR family [Lutibacter oricola]